jgi:F0F1-type ATP synthase membrane subunit b/b'
VDSLLAVLRALQGWGGWAMTLAFLGTLVAVWPRLKAISVAREAGIVDDYAEEVKNLRAEVKEARGEVSAARQELHDCHTQCAEKCKKLQDQIYGMRDQRIQEQLAFFTAIPATLLTPSIVDMIAQLRAMRTERLEEAKEPE